MFAKQIDEREADIETAELLSGEKQNHIFGETKEEQALRWRNFKGICYSPYGVGEHIKKV